MVARVLLSVSRVLLVVAGVVQSGFHGVARYLLGCFDCCQGVLNSFQGVARCFLPVWCSRVLHPLVTFWSGSSVVFLQLFIHPTGENDASDH